jgi:16S rRNA (cytosine967-C5)-methyltransferase
VKSGGRLVYAVCTLTRAETDEVCDAFEREFPEFTRLPLLNPLEPETGTKPALWLWPELGGNGMFVSAWRR